MESEIQWVHDRLRLYVLMKQYPNWSDDSYAEVLNRSVGFVSKWRQRLTQAQPLTLATFMSRSRAPQTRPNQTPEPVKQVIGDLREELSETYHRKAGARLIQLYLNDREELIEAGYFVPNSPSTINNILREMGYIQPKPKRVREPLDLPEPNEEWEMDFGQIRIDEQTILEFFLVVDRGTSRVIYLEGSMGYHAETALGAVARLFEQCGRPKRLRFDRDPRFVGSWTGRSYPSALVRFLRVIGVKPVICPPHRPDKKPFVERTIGTLKYEWLAKHAPSSYADGLEALETFPTYHNQERVHFGRACDGRIPDEKFPNLPALPALPEQVDPNAWLWDDHRQSFSRRITSNGSFQVDKYTYYVGKQYAKSNVLVLLDADQQQFHVLHEDTIIASLEIKGLSPVNQIPFADYLGRMKQEARSIEMHRYMSWWYPLDVA